MLSWFSGKKKVFYIIWKCILSFLNSSHILGGYETCHTTPVPRVNNAVICCCLVTESCLTLCDPMDSNPLGSSVHGVFQARVLEWGAIAFSTSAQKRYTRKKQYWILCYQSIWWENSLYIYFIIIYIFPVCPKVTWCLLWVKKRVLKHFIIWITS